MVENLTDKLSEDQYTSPDDRGAPNTQSRLGESACRSKIVVLYAGTECANDLPVDPRTRPPIEDYWYYKPI